MEVRSPKSQKGGSVETYRDTTALAAPMVDKLLEQIARPGRGHLPVEVALDEGAETRSDSFVAAAGDVVARVVEVAYDDEYQNGEIQPIQAPEGYRARNVDTRSPLALTRWVKDASAEEYAYLGVGFEPG